MKLSARQKNISFGLSDFYLCVGAMFAASSLDLAKSIQHRSVDVG